VFELLPIHESHYALANDWLDTFATGLRALDALHLSLAHSNDAVLITADDTLAASAKTLRVPVKQI